MSDKRNLAQFERWDMTPDDAGYPAKLWDLEQVPAVLHGIGEPSVLESPCLAVVGARRATPYGIAVASMAGA